MRLCFMWRTIKERRVLLPDLVLLIHKTLLHLIRVLLFAGVMLSMGKVPMCSRSACTAFVIRLTSSSRWAIGFAAAPLGGI